MLDSGIPEQGQREENEPEDWPENSVEDAHEPVGTEPDHEDRDPGNKQSKQHQ